jgi:3-methyladenine DNA glycosylase AlkD
MTKSKYSYNKALQEIKKHQNKKNLEGMARFGMSSQGRLGLSMVQMRKIAKDIGTNHQLALELFDSGFVEGRIIAALIDEPEKVTKAQMDKWVKQLTSWDDTDQVCMSLFDRTPHALEMIKKWHRSDDEFVKRSAYSTIAAMAIHDKKSPDYFFDKFFPILKAGATDERNFVKKAVNWALRQIGKRNLSLLNKTTKFAQDLKKLDSKSAHWISNDALREFSNPKIIARVKQRDAKTKRI